ncbi:hypothetical protein CWI37_0171p0050 [Hamiltosporidium tvaerminnensis]|uniref:Uncharacterized protein n=1 Tax=Hamiltosporidium tvaerminnensis TaxID=1176355 RepID=A0A4Q9L9R7_9MICR|nr:hypothetical protein CWI37_0171p0050 [Hamiltosporidium tvaerminnensis]
MFFYIFLCKAALPPENSSRVILEDPTIINKMHMKTSYDDIQVDNKEAKKRISEILNKININKKDQMLKIASFYFNELRDYVKEELHPFLIHFTTLICIIVYNDYNEKDFKAYQPELLFNMICFGKFLEMSKENEDIKKIVQDVFIKFVTNKVKISKNLLNLKMKEKEMKSVISKSFNKEDATDLIILRDIKIQFMEGLKSSTLGDFLSSATFEQLFVFFLYFKWRYFYNYIGSYSADTSYHNSRQMICIVNGDFLVGTIKQEIKSLSSDVNAKFTDQHYIKVFKNPNGFDEIFDFEKNISNFQNKPEDPNFPLVFLQLLCEESDVIFIKALYDFLKEKTTEQYHKYISAVLCLNALCLREETLIKNNIPRIIMEFLFLADVLKTESEKTEKIEIIKKLRKERIDSYKQIFDTKKIEYVKTQDGDYLDCHKVPKITILMEIYCFVELFSNDSFKTFLDKRINEKTKITAKDSKIKESYLKHIFEQEILTLPSEELKLLFCSSAPESPNTDSESKK